MKALIDGIHLLACGAELTVTNGLPASVKFCGAEFDEAQREIEAFTEAWIDDLADDVLIDDGDDMAMSIRLDDEQPTHRLTDAKGQRLVVLVPHKIERHGVMVDCISAMERYEDWPPFLSDGGWYSYDGTKLEPQPILTSLLPEAEA